MTSTRDLEGGASLDEHAPLLAREDVRHDADASLEEDDTLCESQKEVSKTRYYVWRGICVVFAIFVIAVFVKAWISVDDVNVSFLKPLDMIFEESSPNTCAV
jgi:hypothetical protein